jgi:hypothetical protein
VFRTEKRRNPFTGKTCPWKVADTAMINHVYFYFYGFRRRLRRVFHQVRHLLPLHGQVLHQRTHRAQRQSAKAGIGFEALDNGFLSYEDPDRLQRVCHRLDPGRIDRSARKWLARLPHPFTTTDAPSSSNITKNGALRTEMTVNDTRDFGISKRLMNLLALREFGFSANRRLVDVQRISHDPTAGRHRGCRLGAGSVSAVRWWTTTQSARLVRSSLPCGRWQSPVHIADTTRQQWPCIVGSKANPALRLWPPDDRASDPTSSRTRPAEMVRPRSRWSDRYRETSRPPSRREPPDQSADRLVTRVTRRGSPAEAART